MTKGTAFVEEGIKKYEARYKEQQDAFLKRKAKEMGYQLVKIQQLHLS